MNQFQLSHALTRYRIYHVPCSRYICALVQKGHDPVPERLFFLFLAYLTFRFCKTNTLFYVHLKDNVIWIALILPLFFWTSNISMTGYILLYTDIDQDLVFLVHDLCWTMIRNGNSISADFTEDAIKND